jgi:hypothetical protein
MDAPRDGSLRAAWLLFAQFDIFPAILSNYFWPTVDFILASNIFGGGGVEVFIHMKRHF